MSERLWNPQRHEAYLRQREDALARRDAERDGVRAARELDATWSRLEVDQRALLESLARCGAPSCIGSCDDPLLASLVKLGLVAPAPGVRPILTHDLLTAFAVPPAVWIALRARVAGGADMPREAERSVAEFRRRFGARIAMVVAERPPTPGAPGG